MSILEILAPDSPASPILGEDSQIKTTPITLGVGEVAFANIPRVIQKLGDFEAHAGDFNRASADSERDHVVHMMGAAGLKDQDAGAGSAQFLKHEHYISVETQTTPTLTAKLSSKQACGTSPRPYLEHELIEDFISIMSEVKSGNLTIDDADLRIHEVICKVLSYDLLDPNKDLLIPVYQNNSYHLIHFRPILLTLVDGNVGYFLLPHEAAIGEVSPIMMFRGTSLNSSSGSLRADMGFSAILPALISREVFPSLEVGRRVVHENQKFISDLLRDCIDRGHKKVIFLGHSLGGTLASKFSVADSNAQYVEKLSVFNAPGVSKSDLAKYQSLGKHQFSATSYQTEGDYINLIASRRFLGIKKTIQPLDIALNKSDLHSNCVFSSVKYIIKTTNVPCTRKALKIIRTIGWITGINLVLAVAWRFFVLVIPALTVELYHAYKKRGEKIMAAQNAAQRYVSTLSSRSHTPLQKHELASQFYYNYMLTGNGFHSQ